MTQAAQQYPFCDEDLATGIQRRQVIGSGGVPLSQPPYDARNCTEFGSIRLGAFEVNFRLYKIGFAFEGKAQFFADPLHGAVFSQNFGGDAL